MAKKTQTLGGATANTPDKFQAEDDARHLEAAAEIRGNSSRHQAALRHMKTKGKGLMSAVDLEAKVKKGLATAFPKDKEIDNG
jgi:hypothetical protein